MSSRWLPHRIIRLGAWELGAIGLICLGVLMLMQPFMLLLYSYSFITILAGVVLFTIASNSRIERDGRDDAADHRWPGTADVGRVMLGGEDVTFRRASAREFRHLMCGELRALHERLGATTVYVTHDQTEAMTLADRVGVVEHGRLVQIGSPREIYVNPANIYIATRLGSPTINLLPRQLVPDLAAPAMAATVGARTEHVRISKPRATTAWAL